MNDFRTLSDAFAELERRADLAPVATPPARRPRSRAPLIAASVVAVAAIAVGGAVLAGNDHRTPSAAPPIVTTQSAPPASASESASTEPAAFEIPATPAELISRFRTVLGDTATFTVDLQLSPDDTHTGGSYIKGILTAGGHSGGFDLQIFPGGPDLKYECDDADTSHCVVDTLANGWSLATGSEPLQVGPTGGVTLQATVVRTGAGDAVFVMHVSNEQDPKGASELLSDEPPLTQAQLREIITSQRW